MEDICVFEKAAQALGVVAEKINISHFTIKIVKSYVTFLIS